MSKDGSNGKRNAARAKASGPKVKVRRPARRRPKDDETPADREGHTRVGAGAVTGTPPTLDSERTAKLADDERALLGDLLAVIAEHSDDGVRPIDTDVL